MVLLIRPRARCSVVRFLCVVALTVVRETITGRFENDNLTLRQNFPGPSAGVCEPVVADVKPLQRPVQLNQGGNGPRKHVVFH